MERIEHKYRLRVHGDMQQEGIDRHNTFSSVVNWSTVRLLVMMAEMARWESRQIQYVLDLSQAPIGSDAYLYLLEVFHVDGEDKNEICFLKLKKNLYGTCQTAANWFDTFKTGLEDEGLNKQVRFIYFSKKQFYCDFLC